MAKTVTKEDLNAAGCAQPNCGHDHSVIYLHPGCHVGSTTIARYEKATEELILECNTCEKEVMRLKL